jgi:hypothetical protein
VPYEALDWDRQVAMLEAAATAMDLAGRGVIYPAGTLGPLLREEPHRPVDGDPLHQLPGDPAPVSLVGQVPGGVDGAAQRPRTP